MKSLILLLLIALVSSESNLRNLDFIYNCNETYVISSISVLGSTITFKERVGVKNGKAFNQLIIISDTGRHTLGNEGDSSPLSKKYSVGVDLMKINFPPYPDLELDLKTSGTLTCAVEESSGELVLTLSGSIYAKGEITDGSEKFSSVAISAKGTIITLSHTYKINSLNQISKSGNARGGAVSITIEGKLSDMSSFSKSYELWKGWKELSS